MLYINKAKTHTHTNTPLPAMTFTWHAMLVYSLRVLGSGMKPSMHCEELPCLDIDGIYLLFWPSYYTSRVSGDRMGQDRMCMLMALTLFFPFSSLFRTSPTLCRALAMADFLAVSSWFPFACGIPRYLKLDGIMPLMVRTVQPWVNHPVWVQIHQQLVRLCMECS